MKNKHKELERLFYSVFHKKIPKGWVLDIEGTERIRKELMPGVGTTRWDHLPKPLWRRGYKEQGG